MDTFTSPFNDAKTLPIEAASLINLAFPWRSQFVNMSGERLNKGV